jgi:hypothetical protein
MEAAARNFTHHSTEATSAPTGAESKVMNEKLISDLHTLIAFIEANDDFDFCTSEPSPVEFNYHTWYLTDLSTEQKREKLQDLARRLGTAEKQYSGDFFWLKKQFGDTVHFKVTSERVTVCERIVTGLKTIPAAPECILPASPERTEEIVEWRCSPILSPEKGVTL